KIREGHREIMDALYSLSVPLHCVIGNHDDALGVSTSRGLDNTKYAILPHELHSLCMKNNPTDENYYYVDFDDAGIRFVFLNTSDKPYHKDDGGQYPFGWRLEVSDKQVKWFEDEALATDKSIFIVSHSPIHNDGIFGTEGGPEYIKPYDDLLNGPRLYYDIKKSPNVVAMLAGHVHFDNIVYDDRIPVITTLCSLVQEWAPICPKREYGTITETAFDVFSIKDNNIYITRFGAGEDRTAIMLRRGK
nr:metallophosphoesterase [Clostridia bacterium]